MSERRAGCHNRSEYPEVDPALQANLIWSGSGRLEREAVAPIPTEVAEFMRDVSSDGKLVDQVDPSAEAA